MKFFAPFFLFFALNVPAYAGLDRPQRDELFDRVEAMCRDATNVGEIVFYNGSLDAGASFRVLGVDATGNVNKQQWENIEQAFGEFRTNSTICKFEMIKVIIPLFDDNQQNNDVGAEDKNGKTIDFDEYTVGRSARVFGKNVVIKSTENADKYASGRHDESTFNLFDIPKLSKLSIEFDAVFHQEHDREAVFTIKTSSSKRVIFKIKFDNDCCYGDKERVYFQDVLYAEEKKSFSWKDDGSWNSVRFDLFKGDLSVFVNDKLINTASVGPDDSIDSIEIDRFYAHDGITKISMLPIDS